MFKMFLFISILCSHFIALGAANCPSVVEIEKRDVIGLENYVKTSGIDSIACFLSALPKDIRAFRTYFKKSLSLQEASSSNPRALVGSPDGGFFLTFNGHPSQKGFNEIEFLALDKNNGPTKWVAGIISNTNGKLEFQKNVKKCSACHGSPIKPIWGIYPSWPNSFGSIDDWLPDPKNLGKDSNFYEQDIVGNDYGGGQKKGPRLSKDKINLAISESQQFRAFRQKAAKHPRYSSLEKASDNSSPVYPFTEVYRVRNNAFRPNLTIGSVITMRQNEILFNRIAKHPIYLKYKNSIFHYKKCSDVGSSDDYNQTLHSFFSNAYSKKYGKEIIIKDYSTSAFYSDHFFELIGAQPHEKTLLFASDTDYLDEESRYYYSGFFSIIANVIDSLLEESIKKWNDKNNFIYDNSYPYDPYDDIEEAKKRRYFSYFQSEFLGREMYMKLNNSNHESYLFASNYEGATDEQKKAYADMCIRFMDLSKKEMEQSSNDNELFLAEVKTKNPWPLALNTCIQCHDNGSESVAIKIPFKDPSKLARFGLNFDSTFGWGNLFDSIALITLDKMKASHQSGSRMPLGHSPLTDTEKREISEWVKQSLN